MRIEGNNTYVGWIKDKIDKASAKTSLPPQLIVEYKCLAVSKNKRPISCVKSASYEVKNAILATRLLIYIPFVATRKQD
jgi:hypothetical protein